MIIWGGDAYRIRRENSVFTFDHSGSLEVEGAAYDPKRDSWRTIARSPTGSRADAAFAWSGKELIVWGGHGPDGSPSGDGAAYNPRTDRWRVIARGPLGAANPAAYAWTGKQMIVWGSTEIASTNVAGASYDPGHDTWRDLPPAPLALNLSSASWTGRMLVIVGSRLNGANAALDENGKPAPPSAGTRAMAYEPGAKRWHVLPSPHLSPQSTFAVASGADVVAWDYGLRAERLSAGRDRWTELPPIPLREAECYASGQSVGRNSMAVLCAQAALYTAKDNAWRSVIPPRPLDIAATVWTGARIVFWGLDTSADRSRVATWSYRP